MIEFEIDDEFVVIFEKIIEEKSMMIEVPLFGINGFVRSSGDVFRTSFQGYLLLRGSGIHLVLELYLHFNRHLSFTTLLESYNFINCYYSLMTFRY